MTFYFDDAGQRLQSAAKIEHLGERARAIDAIDCKVVFDVSVCSEFPDFPDDLRAPIHRAILRWSGAALPVNADPVSYDSLEDHVRGLNNMISDLHTVFHTLARRRLDGFGDDPGTPLRRLDALAEERREALVGSVSPGSYFAPREEPPAATSVSVSATESRKRPRGLRPGSRVCGVGDGGQWRHGEMVDLYLDGTVWAGVRWDGETIVVAVDPAILHENDERHDGVTAGADDDGVGSAACSPPSSSSSSETTTIEPNSASPTKSSKTSSSLSSPETSLAAATSVARNGSPRTASSETSGSRSLSRADGRNPSDATVAPTVCAYCGQSEGHSRRCSVTKFGVPEMRTTPSDYAACEPRAVKVGDRVRSKSWTQMEWGSGHVVTVVTPEGFGRSSSRHIDVRAEDYKHWHHLDGAEIDGGVPGVEASAPRANDASSEEPGSDWGNRDALAAANVAAWKEKWPTDAEQTAWKDGYDVGHALGKIEGWDEAIEEARAPDPRRIVPNDRRVDDLNIEEALRGLFVTYRNDLVAQGRVQCQPRSMLHVAARMLDLPFEPLVLVDGEIDDDARRSNEVTPPTADSLLHKLWTIAASAPGYDKSTWLALERAVQASPCCTNCKVRAPAVCLGCIVDEHTRLQNAQRVNDATPKPYPCGGCGGVIEHDGHCGPKPTDDWTAANGRSNTSEKYTRIVNAVAEMIGNSRVGDDPRSRAVLIVSQLAHVWNLAPRYSRRDLDNASPVTCINCGASAGTPSGESACGSGAGPQHDWEGTSSVADEIETMVHAFPVGDDRRDSVRDLAARARQLEARAARHSDYVPPRISAEHLATLAALAAGTVSKGIRVREAAEAARIALSPRGQDPDSASTPVQPNAASTTSGQTPEVDSEGAS